MQIISFLVHFTARGNCKIHSRQWERIYISNSNSTSVVTLICNINHLPMLILVYPYEVFALILCCLLLYLAIQLSVFSMNDLVKGSSYSFCKLCFQCLVKGCHKRLRIVHTIEFNEGGSNIQIMRISVYEEEWVSPANLNVEK